MARRIQINVDSATQGTYAVKLTANWLTEALPLGRSNHLSRSEINKLTQTTAQLRGRIEEINKSLSFTELRQVGHLFFRTIFKPELKEKLLGLLAQVSEQEPTRVTLHLPEALANIWWELLYIEGSAPSGFLSAHPWLSFSRYTGNLLWSHSAQPVEQIKILVVVAQPKSSVDLNAAEELKIIQAALAGRERVAVEIIQKATVKKLEEGLSTFKPHILHFIGHARFQSEGQSGLILVNPAGEAALLPSEAMAQLLRRHADECSLVLLNACETAVVEQGYDNSLAGDLVRAGIPAVIGMQSKIPNNIALGLTDSFYTHLLDGFCQPVDWALNQARSYLFTQQRSHHILSRYWCAPVLYSSARNGILFQRREPSNEVDRQAQIQQLVSQLAQLGRWGTKAGSAILAQLKAEGARATPALALALENDSPQLRKRARDALEMIGGDVTPILLKEDFSPQRSIFARKEARQPFRLDFPFSFPPIIPLRPNQERHADQEAKHQAGRQTQQAERDQAEAERKAEQERKKIEKAEHEAEKRRQAELTRLEQEKKKAEQAERERARQELEAYKRAEKEKREREKREEAEKKRREREELKAVEQARQEIVTELQARISTAQSELDAFKSQYKDVEQRADDFIATGEGAIKGLKTLREWSKARSPAEAVAYSDQVSPLVDEINNFLEAWSEWPDLIREMAELENQYYEAQHKLRIYQEDIDRLSKALEEFEAQHPVGFWRRLSWNLSGLWRDLREKQREWEELRLENKTKTMVGIFEKKGAKISAELDRVHGITIYTVDNVVHTITRKRSQRRN